MTLVHTKTRKGEKKKHPNKKTRSWREREEKSVYVLYDIFVTAPTFQAERLPLKTWAKVNTAPQEQRSPMIKRGTKRIKINISANQKKERGKKKLPNKKTILKR